MPFIGVTIFYFVHQKAFTEKNSKVLNRIIENDSLLA